VVKKLKRELWKTGIICVLSLAVIVFATYAWFANNRKTQSDGMQVGVEVQSNLVIAKSLTEMHTMILTDDCFSVDFSAIPKKTLIPATHDWTTGTATGLKYNDNPRAVSSTTGLKRGVTELGFSPVPVAGDDDTKHYYVEYKVFIAAMDAKMATTGLMVDSVEITEGTLTPYMKALSVDFYVGAVSESSYKGTLNLAGQDYRNNAASSQITSVRLTDEGYIPINTSDDILEVTMRFYFDGGLREIEGGNYANRTYVRSNQLDLSGISLKVNFVAPMD